MTHITIAPRVGAVRDPFALGANVRAPRPLIGKSVTISGRSPVPADDVPEDEDGLGGVEPSQNTVPGMRSAQPETFEKVVKRIPTLYVIAFFGVLVACAVSIIWNTLQVNRLSLEKTRLKNRIAQTEQRLIKLRAHEMQLSAPSRIRGLAAAKLGMVEETGSEVVFIRQ